MLRASVLLPFAPLMMTGAIRLRDVRFAGRLEFRSVLFTKEVVLERVRTREGMSFEDVFIIGATKIIESESGWFHAEGAQFDSGLVVQAMRTKSAYLKNIYVDGELDMGGLTAAELFLSKSASEATLMLQEAR